MTKSALCQSLITCVPVAWTMLSVEWVVVSKKAAYMQVTASGHERLGTNYELKSKLRHHLSFDTSSSSPPIMNISYDTHTVLFVLYNDIDSISTGFI